MYFKQFTVKQNEEPIFFSVIASGHRHDYSEYQECSSHSDSLSFLRRLVWREIIKDWRTVVPLQSVEPSLVPL